MNNNRVLSERQKQRRLEEFRRSCRQQGVPWTMQRRVILKAVLDMDSHPTAEEIYCCGPVRKSGISRATVYRTLENLVQMGFIVKVARVGSAVRYDGRTELHHHLVCLKCDAVIDFYGEELNALRVPDASAFGFVVTDVRMQLHGYCSRCRTWQERFKLKGVRDGN